MINLQSGRRNLSDWWRYELIQAKKDLLINAGKQKMSEGGQGLSIVDKPCEESHNTREEIAEDLGWSTGKVAMADKVMRNADTETKDKLKDGDVTINQAYQDIRREALIRKECHHKTDSSTAMIRVLERLSITVTDNTITTHYTVKPESTQNQQSISSQRTG